MLVHVEGVGRYAVLGESLDDAAGEAFDKTAKLLGLPYPGGAALARLAEAGRPGLHRFPRPLLDRPGCDFSFSGLKTAAVLAIRAQPGADEQARADLARGFEDAVVETLVTKTLRALDACGAPRVVVAGGVGANRRLRDCLASECARRGVTTHYPRPLYCTDNAAMIALAGWYRREAGEQDGLEISARARWPVDTLRTPAPARRPSE
jgi:N6-L-threonylcarbamoyladenine synthase